MYEELKIIHYPDPRLKKISAPVKSFNESLKALSERMLQLMRDAKGVGLAAPQVGLNIRLFVCNPTAKPEDDRIYVNPILRDGEGEETAQEGCLSIPGVNIDVIRAKTLRMEAFDIQGKAVTQLETGYLARIWQHEFDHLNGTLLTDRLGPTAKLEFRKILKDLEDTYTAEHPPRPARIQSHRGRR